MLGTQLVVPSLLRFAGGKGGGPGARSGAVLCLAYLCTSLGRLGIAAASVLPPTPTMMLSYLVLNLGQGTCKTLLKSLVSAAAADERLGLMHGVLNSVEKLVGVGAPLIGGPAYARLGPAAPACLASLLALVGGVAAVWVDLSPPAPAALASASKKRR